MQAWRRLHDGPAVVLLGHLNITLGLELCGRALSAALASFCCGQNIEKIDGPDVRLYCDVEMETLAPFERRSNEPLRYKATRKEQYL